MLVVMHLSLNTQARPTEARVRRCENKTKKTIIMIMNKYLDIIREITRKAMSNGKTHMNT